MKKILCSILIMVACLLATKVNASNTFFDTRGTKYEGVVERMAKLEIVNGMNNTTFAPNKGVTRAELAKIVTKLRGIEDYAESVNYRNNFSDVKKDDWFYPYVTIVADLEMINGYEDGTFKPNKEVTYAELIAILLRNLGYYNISEDSPNGWYWNYISKMRELELNDNVGEFNYTKAAKRGDVAMFVWNTLITDRWAVSMENNYTGFTYTYSDITQLEMFFEDYSFLDNETVISLGGYEERVEIYTSKGSFYTNEKTPLYVLGGKVTGLYNKKTRELIGVTFDEEYQNLRIESGPDFYLEDEGYRLNSAMKSVAYGSKADASYVYLVINEENDRIIRAVYLDASDSIFIDSIGVTMAEESGDRGPLKNIKLNEEEYSSRSFAVIENGLPIDIGKLKVGEILTEVGFGLYVYSNEKITDTISNFDRTNNIVKIDEDEYVISENCKCYLYDAKDAINFNIVSSKKLDELIGIEATLTLNAAEEVCVMSFGKTKADNERYKIGFVTDVIVNDDTETIKINYGESEQKKITLTVSNDNYIVKGDLISLSTGDDGKEYSIITSDMTFDNDIAIRYDYEAKKISYPLIGEYRVTEDTSYYKVTLEYHDNSVTSIKSCKVERLNLGKNISDLLAYRIILIYNENMEVVKVYAINEINKFDNQIALVKNKSYTIGEKKEKITKVSLSIVNDAVRGFDITGEEDKYDVGNIITFSSELKGDKSVLTLDEVFKKEFIGYKRDLTVSEYDSETKSITFTDESKMQLTKDIYDWNGEKINLNRYRFVIAKVSKLDGEYLFTSLDIEDREDLRVEKGDRIAIGELKDVIVIYRGYKD